MNVHLNKTSTFAALRNPVYRKLWLAILLSGTCVAAQDTAATWTMNMLGSSTLLLSLISTVASVPFFLFTLPAGALADMVNRRKLLCIMNLWLAGAAVLLAIPEERYYLCVDRELDVRGTPRHILRTCRYAHWI